AVAADAVWHWSWITRMSRSSCASVQSPAWAPSQSTRPVASNASAWTCSKAGFDSCATPIVGISKATMRAAIASALGMTVPLFVRTALAVGLARLVHAHHPAHHEVHAERAGKERDRGEQRAAGGRQATAPDERDRDQQEQRRSPAG